jgi:predicted HAD superfamily Cof-like phosphohydrolase
MLDPSEIHAYINTCMKTNNKDWVQDIAEMHAKFGFHPIISGFDKEKLAKFLEFRLNFLQEELNEAKAAKSADDVVDAMIDLIVVAIGTLDAYEVDAYEAWDRVHTANMTKKAGIKPNRPNPLGLPDLMKPEGWVAPTHVDNVGTLSKLFP